MTGPRAAESEIRQVWADALPVTADDRAVAWLRGRGFTDDEIEQFEAASGVVKALTPGAPVPHWATIKGERWSDTDYRLIFQVVDQLGISGLRAQWIGEGAPTGPKAVGGKGVAASGTLGNWPWCDHIWNGRPPSSVLICEGEPDWLALVDTAILYPGRAVAVVGLVHGWRHVLGSLLPSGVPVHVLTHNDDAGRKYRAEVIASAPHAQILGAL